MNGKATYIGKDSKKEAEYTLSYDDDRGAWRTTLRSNKEYVCFSDTVVGCSPWYREKNGNWIADKNAMAVECDVSAHGIGKAASFNAKTEGIDFTFMG